MFLQKPFKKPSPLIELLPLKGILWRSCWISGRAVELNATWPHSLDHLSQFLRIDWFRQMKIEARPLAARDIFISGCMAPRRIYPRCRADRSSKNGK